MSSPHYADDWLTVYHGDTRAVMAEMEPESVHCVVTSPPYWGLRDYGQDGQLGLEATPEAYVASMVDVFREVRRVLRSDGTVWLNLGDSYAATTRGSGGDPNSPTLTGGRRTILDGQRFDSGHKFDHGLKPKDLVGIPWMVAFALRSDGWYLRSDIIWSKPNPMPESVTDRPTKSHEYLFLLTKSPRYYFDADAVRGASYGEWVSASGFSAEGQARRGGAVGHANGKRAHSTEPQSGRNIRSVWTVATAPYPGAHFATFPPKLIEPCIKAGTSEKGVCPECGAPWEREVDRPASWTEEGASKYDGIPGHDTKRGSRPAHLRTDPSRSGWGSGGGSTTGWHPGCRCEHDGGGWVPVPATVLDPFAGSGTTGLVAQKHSRRAVLIDLSMDYLGQLLERNRDIPLGLGA